VALRRLVSPELLPTWIDAMPYSQMANCPSLIGQRLRRSTFPPVSIGSSGTQQEPGENGLSLRPSSRFLGARATSMDTGGRSRSVLRNSVALKGFERANEFAANGVLEKLWEWSDGGRLRVVTDASSCALGLHREILPYLSELNRSRHERLEILDSITWRPANCFHVFTSPTRQAGRRTSDLLCSPS